MLTVYEGRGEGVDAVEDYETCESRCVSAVGLLWCLSIRDAVEAWRARSWPSAAGFSMADSFGCDNPSWFDREEGVVAIVAITYRQRRTEPLASLLSSLASAVL